MVEKLFCDGCEKEFKRSVNTGTMEITYHSFIDGSYDLCKKCSNKVEKFINKLKERGE